jgi:hypothetical protein
MKRGIILFNSLPITAKLPGTKHLRSTLGEGDTPPAEQNVAFYYLFIMMLYMQYMQQIYNIEENART